MKTKLYLLSFLFSFVLLSCKEDESQHAQMHLSKVTYANSLYPDRAYLSDFSYNSEGLLNEYREIKDGNIVNEYVHFYDDSNRILKLDLKLKLLSHGNLKQIFTYDQTGRLSSATVTREGEADPYLYLTLQYGDNGRVVRLDSRPDPAEAGMAFILEYDNVGNIIQETSFNTSQTGELLGLIHSKKITYDDKKNPFYQLGSPWLAQYGYTLPYISRHITFFSINNPIRVEVYDVRGYIVGFPSFDYQYNQKRYPSQLSMGHITYQFDYAIK